MGLLHRQQNEREQPINPKHLQLLERIPLDKEPESNELIEHINSGLDLINDTFETYSLSIYAELSALFKQARAIFQKIHDPENKDQVGPLHLFLREKFKEIADKSSELEKIKLLLDIDNLTKMAAQQKQIELDRKVMELRFSHLNAKQLVVLSDVIAFVKNDLTGRVEQLSKKQLSQRTVAELKRMEALLKMILQGILDSMKLRLEANDVEVRSINVLESQPNLTTSFLLIPENQTDNTIDKEVPPLPFSEHTKFECIPNYFLNYLYRFGNETEQNWAENHKGYVKHTTIFKKFTGKFSDYFNPEENPYVGIVKDLLDYTWVNYAEPAFTGVKDTVQDGVDRMRGNWLAVGINDMLTRIQQNQNFVKIQEDLAGRYEILADYFKSLNDYVRKCITWEQVTPINALSTSTLSTNPKEVIDDNHNEIDSMNIEFDKLESELNEERQIIESRYKELTQNWVKVEDEKDGKEEITENKTVTEDEAIAENVETTDKSIEIKDTEKCSAERCTDSIGQLEIHAQEEISEQAPSGTTHSTATPQTYTISQLITEDGGFSEWYNGGEVYFDYLNFIRELEKIKKIDTESYRKLIIDAYHKDYISFQTLIQLNRLVLNKTEKMTSIQLENTLKLYDQHEGKGVFRKLWGETKTISQLRELINMKDSECIYKGDIELVMELRDKRSSILRKGDYQHRSLSLFHNQISAEEQQKNKPSHTEEAIINLSHEFNKKPK